MPAKVMSTPFDAWEALATFEAEHPELQGECGAATLFIGRMRDRNEGETVAGMFLEHYPAMTQSYLGKLCAEADARWHPREILLLHRAGDISIGETIVLVAVWSAHRAAALEACQYLIEELKHRAPFWKKERLSGGEARWVSGNTPGPVTNPQG